VSRAVPSHAAALRLPRDWPALLLLAAVTYVLYRPALAYMLVMWRVPVFEGADYSHGPLLPLVSLGALWIRRHALQAAPKRCCPGALLLVVPLLVLHWVGLRSEFYRLSLLSLIGLLWSAGWYLYGPATARLLVFPCAYLLFCVPLNFLDAFSFRLRLLAATLSAGLLNGLGIAAHRSGSAIYSAAGGSFSFDVADPCSGLRSLLALSALAAAYAQFTQPTLTRKWLLFLLAVPIAILANVVRIVSIAVAAQVWGQAVALRVYHDYSGYIVFLAGTVLLMAAGRLTSRLWRGRRQRGGAA